MRYVPVPWSELDVELSGRMCGDTVGAARRDRVETTMRGEDAKYMGTRGVGLTASKSAVQSKRLHRRTSILSAAADAINQKGVRSMTLGEVASKLDLVPTALHYYFKRKEDLAAACFMQSITHYKTLLDRADAGPTPAARLQSFLSEFADYFSSVEVGNSDPIAGFNDVRLVGNAEVNRAYASMFRRVRHMFLGEIGTQFGRIESNARTHLLLSQFLSAVRWLRQYDPADYRRMIERLYDVLVNGLASTSAQWAPVLLPSLPELGTSTAGSREGFLPAATLMINEHGYIGASVSRISAQLNLSKGSFYHHHQAKSDIVEQCFERTFLLMRSSQLAADACAESGFDNIATLVASMVYHDVSGKAPLLRTSALTAVPEEKRTQLIKQFERLSSRVASVISDGIVDGSIRPVDSNVAAHAINATINASAELLHWAPGIDAPQASEVYAKALFVGVLGGGSRDTQPESPRTRT
jgi:AcrR family transcriptional regulator